MDSAAIVTMYEGKMGGGKSYAAVKAMAYHLARGLTICTNVEILWDGMVEYVRGEFGVEVIPSQFINLLGRSVAEFQKITPSGMAGALVLIVIDETHLEFNARDWSATSRDLLSYLTQARKMHNRVIFISQSIENIDKQFRRLMGEIWRFKDLEDATVPGLGIKWSTLYQCISFGMSDGKKILTCRFDCDGRTMLGKQFTPKDVRVFKAYNTNSLLCEVERLGVVGRIALSKSAQRGGAALRVVMAIVGLFLLGALVWWKFLRPEKEKPALIAQVDMRKPTPTPAPVPARNEETGTAFRKSAERMEMESQHRESNRPKAAFLHLAEDFVGWDGDTLRTRGGSYRVGVVTERGMCMGVSRYGARLLDGYGQLILIGVRDVIGNGTDPAQGFRITDAKAKSEKDAKTPDPRRPRLGGPDPEDIRYEAHKNDPSAPGYKEVFASLTPMEKLRGGYATEEWQNAVSGLGGSSVETRPIGGLAESPKAKSAPEKSEPAKMVPDGVVKGNRVFRNAEPGLRE